MDGHLQERLGVAASARNPDVEPGISDSGTLICRSRLCCRATAVLRVWTRAL